MTTITTKPITAADVHEMEAQGISREIINGQWVEGEAAGKRHGKIGAKIVAQFVNFLEGKSLGEVYQDSVGYVLEGNKDDIKLMLIPDVSFVATERVIDSDPDDFYYQAPDLSIEIISPSEWIATIRKKVKNYLKYGTEQVWLVFPDTQEVTVHFADGTSRTYADSISGDDLLPGFALDIAKIFK